MTNLWRLYRTMGGTSEPDRVSALSGCFVFRPRLRGDILGAVSSASLRSTCGSRRALAALRADISVPIESRKFALERARRDRKAERPPAATRPSGRMSEDFASRRACGTQKTPAEAGAKHKLGETPVLCYKALADVEICDGLRNLRSAFAVGSTLRPRRLSDDDFLSSDDYALRFVALRPPGTTPAARRGGALDCS